MLYAFPADRTGCGFYRVVWPLSELRSRLPSTVTMPGDDVPLKADLARYTDAPGTPTVKAIEVPDDCSAVLLQRPTSVLLVQCIPFLKAAGIRVIVEIDDDLHALTPRHAAYKAFNPPKSKNPFEPEPLVNSLAALKQACALADLVICSTPALVDRYAPGKGVVLRNRLRSDWRSCLKNENLVVRTGTSPAAPRVSPILHVPNTADYPPSDDLEQALVKAMTDPIVSNLRLGWAGVITTHPDDLAVLNRALPRLSLDCGFTIVGPVPEESAGGIIRAQRLLGITGVTFTGSVTFADWLPHLSNSLDVAVAPLEDNVFNASKSWLKPLEYAACGLPCVIQDTPEYRRLNRCGVGLLATDHKSYRHQLNRLLTSPALRDDLIATGYSVADTCTYANYADDWYNTISPYVEGCT